MVSSIYAFHKNRRFTAAALMALAISFKLTPFVFVLYYLIKRETRHALDILLVFLALNLVPPLVFWGLKEGSGLFSAWYGAQAHLGGMNAAKLSNYSLFSFLSRYLTGNSWSDRGLTAVNFLALPGKAVVYLYLAAVIAFAAYFARAVSAGKKTAGTEMGEYSLLVTGMLLLSPVSWQHHFVLLLIPCAYVAGCISGNRESGPVLPLAAGFLILSGMTSPGIMGKKLSNALMSYSVITAGCLLLLAAAAFCFARENDKS